MGNGPEVMGCQVPYAWGGGGLGGYEGCWEQRRQGGTAGQTLEWSLGLWPVLP